MYSRKFAFKKQKNDNLQNMNRNSRYDKFALILVELRVKALNWII